MGSSVFIPALESYVKAVIHVNNDCISTQADRDFRSYICMGVDPVTHPSTNKFSLMGLKISRSI